LFVSDPFSMLCTHAVSVAPDSETEHGIGHKYPVPKLVVAEADPSFAIEPHVVELVHAEVSRVSTRLVLFQGKDGQPVKQLVCVIVSFAAVTRAAAGNVPRLNTIAEAYVLSRHDRINRIQSRDRPFKGPRQTRSGSSCC